MRPTAAPSRADQYAVAVPHNTGAFGDHSPWVHADVDVRVAGGRARVLHVGKYYPPVPGGMERVLQLLCERERHHVDSRVLVVNTGQRTHREVLNGIVVTRAGRLALIGSVGVSPMLPVELRRTVSDITVLHEPNPLALVADCITARRGPLVVYFHSEVVRPAWQYRLLYRPFLTRVLNRADRIIVASPSMLESATQLAGYRHKCRVIPYGIDTETLRLTPAIQARVRQIRTGLLAPLLLFVGRLVPYKGVDVLIRALAATPGQLVIVGDGPLRASLQQLASTCGVASRVRFAGAVPDSEVLALYHACDLFVLPSVTRAEAFGMVQLEAMACGKPVISTDLPSGVPWVNQHDESGLIVPPGDIEALRAAIERLSVDTDLRERLGIGARRRVEAEFTAARMAERMVAVYRDVLQERAVSPAA
jgi:glycosyltransferase involved in cell wall biosynthesis